MENKDYKIIGLTAGEANERIAKYGRNEIGMERPPRVRVLLSKFWGLASLDARTNHYFRLDLVLGRWVEACLLELPPLSLFQQIK